MKGTTEGFGIFLNNLKKISGSRFTIRVFVRSNSGLASEDPAFYGDILENSKGYIARTGRDYSFLKPSLENFSERAKKDIDIKDFISYQKLSKKGRNRSKEQMIEASKFLAEKAVDDVLYYILYEAPQYDRKRKNPSLIDTQKLLNAITFEVIDKDGIVVSRGY